MALNKEDTRGSAFHVIMNDYALKCIMISKSLKCLSETISEIYPD